MKALQIYREVWQGIPRSEPNIISGLSPQDQKSVILLCSLLLLESGMTSALELRGARFLYDMRNFVEEDQALQFFLLMIYTELRRGSIRLGKKPENNLQENYRQNLDLAYNWLAVKDKQGYIENSVSISVLLKYFKGKTESIASGFAAEFLNHFASGYYKNIISPEFSKPIIGNLENQHESFYFSKYYQGERAIDRMIGKRLENSKTDFPDRDIRESIEQILVQQPLKIGHKKIEFNDEQKLALTTVARSRFVIISGGPGTGKTTIIVNILRLLRRLMGVSLSKVRLAAPTGRAAAHMRESVFLSLSSLADEDAIEDLEFKKLNAMTIHRLLAYNPSRSAYTYTKDNPLKADLLIVDEVSMVDISMFNCLLEAVPLDTHVVLLGDQNQLPSVEAGAVLGDFTRKHSLRDHLVFLNQSHRSEKSIVKVSEHVNHGRFDEAIRQMGETLHISDGGIEWPIPVVREDGSTGCENGGCRLIPFAKMERSESLPSVLFNWAEFHYIKDSFVKRQLKENKNLLFKKFAYPVILESVNQKNRRNYA